MVRSWDERMVQNAIQDFSMDTWMESRFFAEQMNSEYRWPTFEIPETFNQRPNNIYDSHKEQIFHIAAKPFRK